MISDYGSGVVIKRIQGIGNGGNELQLDEASEKAAEMGVDNMAFVRVEQLYPFPEKQIDAVLNKYKNSKRIVWAQEEPENMGAWNFLLGRLYGKVNLQVVARKCSASTATGYKKVHGKEQEELLKKAFA